jgi:valyl-tRNA synthetase
MSKSLGNSPDPLELIEKYGADGVRVGMLLCSPAGNDLMFDESHCEQGRNFWNKVWNAFRLIKGFEIGEVQQSESAKSAIEWFDSRFAEQLQLINEHYDKYRMSDALMTTYKLVWDDFCAWYLEAIKPEFVDGKALPIDKETYSRTIAFMENLLKVMHPWMPFITEELWHQVKERPEKDCVIVAEWPKAAPSNAKRLQTIETSKDLVAALRNLRQQKQISPKIKLDVHEKLVSETSIDAAFVTKLANLNTLKPTREKIEGAISLVIGTSEFYVSLTAGIDPEEEKKRLVKDLEYNKGFLRTVQTKLSNEKFVANAKPEVLAIERKKESDALSKIKSLEEQLAGL